MKTKPLFILACLTIFFLGLAAWAVIERELSIKVAEVPESLFPELVDRVNDVKRVEVVTGKHRFSIELSGKNSWSVPERGGYPVKFETVKQAVVGIAGLKPLERKTGRPELHSRLGLRRGEQGGEGTEIVLKDNKGVVIAGVVIGNTKSPGNSEREGWLYVRKSNDNNCWLASGRVEVWEQINRWLDNDMPIIKRERIRFVRSIKPNGEIIEIDRNKPNQRDFKITTLPQGSKMIHETVANSLGSALGFMNFEDVREVRKLNFSDPTIVEFYTFDGLILIVKLKKKNDLYWAHFDTRFDLSSVQVEGLNTEDGKHLKSITDVKLEVESINKRYAKWAYQLPEYKVKDFIITLNELIVRQKGS